MPQGDLHDRDRVNVIFAQAIETTGVEALDYMSNHDMAGMAPCCARGGLTISSNMWRREGVGKFFLGHPDIVEAVTTANEESLLRAQQLETMQELGGSPIKRLRLEVTMGADGELRPEQSQPQESYANASTANPMAVEDGAMEEHTTDASP